MRFYLFLAIIIIVVSCKSGKLQKKGVDLGNSTEEPGKSTSITKAELEINRFDFSQIRFKSDVDLQSKAISQKFPITIHVQKDAVIWASVSIGLEIGRAKITKDSLVFLDRFNRKAYLGTWDELSYTTGFNLDYNTLQSLLIGDMLFEISDTDSIETSGSVSTVFQEREGLGFVSKIDNTVHRLFELGGKDPKSGATLLLNFKSFISENNRLVPSVISMLLSGNSDTKLDVKHSRIEFQDSGLSFAFTIPANYKIEKLPGL